MPQFVNNSFTLFDVLICLASFCDVELQFVICRRIFGIFTFMLWGGVFGFFMLKLVVGCAGSVFVF